MSGPLSPIPIVTASIHSPSARWFNLGPLVMHYDARFIIRGVAAAVWLTCRPWTARGGNGGLVYEGAL